MKKGVKIILFSVFVAVFILAMSAVAYFMLKENVESCNDGTLYNECSVIKPYFCSNGVLIEKASVCRCNNLLKVSQDKCISPYQDTPKNITLNYVLRGKEGKIDFVVYEKMYNYVSAIPRYVDSRENITLLDFKMKLINESSQREFLLPLIVEIESLTNVKEDQARIAMSIVQNIPFGSSNKTIKIGNLAVEYQRYPYEVLYDLEGICSEKAELLIFLLREIGYGTAFLYYPAENHEAVGVKCQIEKSNFDGYCFVETTAPSIMGDDKTEYFGAIRQLNSTPIVMISSYGLFFDKNFYEYKDSRDLIRMRESSEKYGGLSFIESFMFKALKKKYGMATFYGSYQF
jgi:hypothetical protein